MRRVTYNLVINFDVKLCYVVTRKHFFKKKIMQNCFIVTDSSYVDHGHGQTTVENLSSKLWVSEGLRRVQSRNIKHIIIYFVIFFQIITDLYKIRRRLFKHFYIIFLQFQTKKSSETYLLYFHINNSRWCIKIFNFVT